MAFDRLSVRIIDTPQFQRLRELKQLGTSYRVFPGASHNRFEHSLGVGHLAGTLLERLRNDILTEHAVRGETVPWTLRIEPRLVVLVRIAGLVHDLGHGPFSHVFDNQFIGPLREERKQEKWCHELMSMKMFDWLVTDTRSAAYGPDDVDGGGAPSDATAAAEAQGGSPAPSGTTILMSEPEIERWYARDRAARPPPTRDGYLDAEDFASAERAHARAARARLVAHASARAQLLPFEVKLIKDIVFASDRYKESVDRCRLGKGPVLPHGIPADAEERRPFVYQIVANAHSGLDVDKFDYLVRDAACLGLEERFTFERILQQARIIDGELCFCASGHGYLAALECYKARFEMHKRIYGHKSTQALDLMVADVLRAADAELDIASRVDDPARYLSLTDAVLGEVQASGYSEAERDVVLERADALVSAITLCSATPAEREDVKARANRMRDAARARFARSEALADARRIARRIATRELYACVDEYLVPKKGASRDKLPRVKSADVVAAMEAYRDDVRASLPLPLTRGAARGTRGAGADSCPATPADSAVDFGRGTEEARRRDAMVLELWDKIDAGEADFPADAVLVKDYRISYGKGALNPMDDVRFYRRNEPDRAFQIKGSEVTHTMPSSFCERVVKVFSRDNSLAVNRWIHKGLRRLLRDARERCPDKWGTANDPSLLPPSADSRLAATHHVHSPVRPPSLKRRRSSSGGRVRKKGLFGSVTGGR